MEFNERRDLSSGSGIIKLGALLDAQRLEKFLD